MHKVFVYGTLRKGERNHVILKNSTCVAEKCWVYGELHDTGYGYPAIIPSSKSKVIGELYDVTDDVLQRLDFLEGYSKERRDNLYERKMQTVFMCAVLGEAHVYCAGKQLTQRKNVIHSGDWKLYQTDQFVKE